MLRQRAFKYEMEPTGEQKRAAARFEGSCRFVFNKALALQIKTYETGGKYISYVDMAKQLTAWRHSEETPWLKQAPCHPLQQTLKDLDKAYKGFFVGRSGFPRFKQKGKGGSFRFPDALQIKLDEANSRIFLPKLGWIRYRSSRKITGKLCNVTLSNQNNKRFLSIQTEEEIPTPLKTSSALVGIDMGITHFATLSSGESIAPINSFKKEKGRLTKYQRRLAHKVKFSKNWNKAKKEVQKAHARVANVRKDFLHKVSSDISKNHAVVIMEDLKVTSMSKSAKGTVEKPGQKVAKKKALNRSILDQGWGQFRQMLEYKMKWSGGTLRVVPPQYTSQECPHCGHTSSENRTTQAAFKCAKCSYKNNADIVGAINILERGLRLLACGDAMPLGSLYEAGTHRSILAS